jgi:hypothetical protein
MAQAEYRDGRHTSGADPDKLIAMFSHRQQLRRWAARVLFLWLFGVGASTANACLTTGQPGPAGTMDSHPMVAMADHHNAAPHDHAQLDAGSLQVHNTHPQPDQNNVAKANCHDFCEKATVSIPLKSALDDLQSHAAIAMTSVTVLPMPAFAPVQMWVPRRDGVLAPPILIAFLRLAL